MTRCTDGGEIWRGGGEGPLLHANFHPHRCNVSSLWGEIREKPQNRPLSKLNTDACALRNAAGNYISGLPASNIAHMGSHL